MARSFPLVIAVTLVASIVPVPAGPAAASTAPANDDFVAASALAGDAGSLLGETNVDASAEPGEPVHDGHSGGRSVWYRWTPSVDGNAVITVTTPPVPDDWDSVLAVYTGAAVDSLTEIASRNTTLQILELEVPVAAGTTYHIAIDGRDSTDTGTFDLSWLTEVPPGNDDFVDATTMSLDIGWLPDLTNKLATAEPGEPSHDGHPATPVHSVWFEWTPSQDALATIVVTTPSSPDDWDSVLAVYTGSAVDSLTEVAANRTVGTTLPLEFPATAGVTYRVAIDGQNADQMGAFDLEWSTWPDSQHFVVTKTEDTNDGVCDADCSLREAVGAANSTAGDDTIELPAGTYPLTLSSEGMLVIEREQGTTSILGAGRDITVIDAAPLAGGPGGVYDRSRVFYVGYHAGLGLVGVTITGGYTVSGADKDGGGIFNFNGYLTVTDCIIEGNVSGENGGGIANFYGTATITDSIIRNNHTNPPEYGSYGSGGGIYNSGTMIVSGSLIEGNAAEWGGGGLASEYWLEDYYPNVTIEDTIITGNAAGGGVGGGVVNIEMMPFGTEEAVLTITESVITDNTAAGGGGVQNHGYGAATYITDSTISDNVATASVHSPHTTAGSGGGVQNFEGRTEISRTTISGNNAIYEQLPGDNMQGGRGGGILNVGAARLIVSNSTISGNSATLIGRAEGDWRGGGVGGGLSHARYCDPVCRDPIYTTVISTTITGNEGDTGGGIDNTYEKLELTVENSIVNGNVGQLPDYVDCWGANASGGHNLVGIGTGCPADAAGDITGGDARLGPLADNGGPNLTHMPLRGSPAIDSGATDEAFDQRGVSRPIGAADDIGAVEAPVYPNAPPVLDPIGSQWVAEGDTVDVMITAFDSDGDTVGFFITGHPSFAGLVDHGDNTATLMLSPGYDDAGSYPGVVIEASDGIASDSETITITVSDTNRAPTGDDQAVSTPADTPVAVTLTGSDPDGDPLTYTIDVGPSHGSLSGTPPAVTYTPNPGYVGPDSFTFVVDDGDLTSAPATVSITVTPPPTGSVTGVVRHEGVPLAGVEVWLGYGDRHMCTLGDGTFSFADVPAGEILVAVTGPAQVLPCANADFVNSQGQPLATQAWDHKRANEPWDEFTLSPGEEKEVAFDVVVRQAPVAVNDTAAVDNGGTVTINVLANDHNPEGYAVEIVKTSDPLHGAMTLQPDGMFLYSHDGSNTTTDSFTYKLDDAVLESPPATVTITVHPPGNEPPVLDPMGDRLVAEGDTVEVTITASDPDGDTVGFVITGNPSFAGLVDHGDNTATLTLSPGYEDGGIYPGVVIEANDGVDNDTETITITVADTNRAPIAVADGPYEVAQGEILTVNGVLDNDTDPDGDALTAVKSTDPEHGTLTLHSDGSFSYAHDGSAAAADSFTYRAFDGIDHSGVTTVAIVITHVLPDALEPTSVGLVDPSQGRWHLRDYTTGVVTSFFYGNPGDIPFMGDWNCDGVATPGLFRQSDAFAYLRNSNTVGIADIRFFFGNPSDVPLAGDFDGDGCDTLSIYRPSEQRFYIMNQLGKNEGGLGAADYAFTFGNPGDKPVVGDWDGDGIDEVGLHRESTGFFYYRNTLDTGIASGEFYFGDPGDRFVAGDWGQVDRVETPAVFRPGSMTFYFRWTNTPGVADSQFVWGDSGWLPVSGVID